jgi:hypothetical protein
MSVLASLKAGAIAGFYTVKTIAHVHLPTALVVGGIACGGVAIYQAIKNTMNSGSKLKKDIDNIREINMSKDNYDRVSFRKAKGRALKQFAHDVVSIHWKTIIAFVAAIGLTATGHVVLARRAKDAAAIAAANAATVAIMDNNLRKLGGDDFVNAIHSEEWTPGDLELCRKAVRTNDDGSETVEYKSARDYPETKKVQFSSDKATEFTYCMDTVGNPYYSDPVGAIMFLWAVQNEVNFELARAQNGYKVFLSDVLERIGATAAECEKYHRRAYYWGAGETADFGIRDLSEFIIGDQHAAYTEDLRKLYENDIPLRFNCSGIYI